jgi:hypothetical protein
MSTAANGSPEPVTPLAIVAGREPRLDSLLVQLRSLITTAATPQHLPDNVLLAWFASKLWSVPLELRPTVATPEHFRLFTEILASSPPPLLVDAICSAMECALRTTKRIYTKTQRVEADEQHRTYTKTVCTPALAKALCDLMARGAEYASVELIRMLSFVVDTEDFKALSALDSVNLLRLCWTDQKSAAFRRAQELHTGNLLVDYAAVPFPKPTFPLGEECLRPCFRQFNRSHRV